MASTSKYKVVADRASWLEGEGRDGFPAYADKDEEIELTSKQAERLLKIGAIVKADSDAPLVSEAAEPRELGIKLPVGQSDPASLAQYPPEHPSQEETLSAGQLASMGVREVQAHLATHPEQRESILKMEKAGRDRPGVIAAATPSKESQPPEGESGKSGDQTAEDKKAAEAASKAANEQAKAQSKADKAAKEAAAKGAEAKAATQQATGS